MQIDVTTTFFILSALVALCLLGVGIVAWQLAILKRAARWFVGDKEAMGENATQEFFRRLAETEIKLDEILPRLAAVEGIGKRSIQKVGFLRFNPFHDTGGDNSFVLALLDHNNSGVIMTSLYSREGVRWYGKSVERGVSPYPFSKEEKKVLEETMQK